MKGSGAKHKKAEKDEVDEYLAQVNARSMFIGASMNMGWKLAVLVVVPIVAGVKLDDYLKSSPSWTLAGLIIAAFGACIAVASAVKEANAATGMTNDTPKKRRKNA